MAETSAERVELRLERISSVLKQQEDPACACCGYAADWLVRVGSLVRMFCERDMRDALLDAINFSVSVPDSL